MSDTAFELLSPPERERLGERIAAEIRHRILSTGIGAGQKLPSERDLAGQLKVSRVVIREALQILECSGLIAIRAGGAVVTDELHKPVARSIADLYDAGRISLEDFVDVRRANECLVARAAAKRAVPRDVETLAAINETVLGALKDRGRLRATNMAFHVALAEIAGNPLSTLVVRSLFDLLDALRPRSLQTDAYVHETYRYHREIIAALAQGDADRCAEAVARDVERTARLLDTA